MKLSPKAFGTTAGVFWGIILFVMTLIATKNGYAADQLNLLVGLYPWYEISTNGAFVGLLVGFVDAFVGCYVFAWLYNYFLCSCGECEMPKKAVASKVRKTTRKTSRRKKK